MGSGTIRLYLNPDVSIWRGTHPFLLRKVDTDSSRESLLSANVFLAICVLSYA